MKATTRPWRYHLKQDSTLHNARCCQGGRIAFDAATLSHDTVTFDGATTSSSGMVAFERATFSGGTVTFDGRRFSGGTVDLRHRQLTASHRLLRTGPAPF
jgi:hypothetical protein